MLQMSSEKWRMVTCPAPSRIYTNNVLSVATRVTESDELMLVESHPNTGEVLRNGRGRALAAQLFDVRGHMHRLNAPEHVNPLPFAPA